MSYLVTNEETLKQKVADLKAAQAIFATYTQEQVDAIFYAGAKAANEQRIPLAKMAVEETGMGLVEDKVIKNHFASEFVYNKYKDAKTVGLISEDEANGFAQYAEPIGVVAAVVPTTNPTSTAIFKTLMALKTRNAIFLAPHPRARKATIAAAKVVMDAAVAAGAPEGLLGWIDGADEGVNPVALTGTLMAESDIILATGGPGMVKAAYSSGTPAIGVGAGNVSVLVDETADPKAVAAGVVHSKSFDYGVICASEQAVVVHDSIYDEVKAEFTKVGAYILNKTELKKVRNIILNENGALNAAVVGQSPQVIAELAGIKVPEWTRIIIGEVEDPSLAEPFAHEKLSIILAMYKYSSFEEGVEMAHEMIMHGGLGHTAAMYADELVAKERIDAYAAKMPTARIVVNSPTAQGGIGDIFNFVLAPSLTLGCGSWGGNAVSENIGPKHLLNTKSVAKRRENMLWMQVPEKVYFKYGALQTALTDLKDDEKKRVFVVTDKSLFDLGYTKKITNVLDGYGIQYKLFSDVLPDPTIETVEAGAASMRDFGPDCIIALGGGSAMDAGKVMWMMYENPEANFKDMAITFMDMRKRVYKFPKLGKLANFIAVPTTSGTGSEVTPFSVITDRDGTKYPLADYSLTPSIAIVDPELTMTMPRGLAVASGVDVFTHALEAYVSVVATDYTMPQSVKAGKLVLENLVDSANGGATAKKAKENMANASCLAGMAFANAFLGICHSLAHKLGAKFHVPHGIANALLLSEVIKYNATDRPWRQGTFSQYEHPAAIARYAQYAREMGLTGKDDVALVEALVKRFDDLKAELGIPASIKEWGVSEEEFLAAVDQLSEDAFDDQCTGANPRYPMIADLKEIYLRSYYGTEYKGEKTYEIGK
ncbi:bifunctional acetaldehyde-CoA/alcohol dehydrogenase [Mollicutes bacterium LVI A0078]|nr:bifunctional acetaldehyde-CoA/alcohol dehydrogenase [Mollicutes bacterium LVI A0075]WOO91643.1 bifunctional acetaldehyde-CoA/alcohol dehydrogenase [Mollicutes bacterium LVI A0078]